VARRFRCGLAETGPFVCRCLTNPTMPRFHRTGGVTASGSRKRLTLFCVTPSATSEHKPGAARLIVNPHVLCCFLRPSLTEVPSLCRSYSASSVVRTSPPPQTARPGSRELPVDPELRSPLGLPVLRLIPYVCMPSPMPRQVRGSEVAHLLLPRHRPSPGYGWVGSCITSFGACSAFTRVTTCRLTESPFATLYTGGSGGLVASTAAPIVTGWSDPVPGRVFSPAVDQRLSRAHCYVSQPRSQIFVWRRPVMVSGDLWCRDGSRDP
jgi:hypothetical protein